MKIKEIENEVKLFSDEWQRITMAYSDYARSVGISYTSLQILKYITGTENCTQKSICQMSFLPKQTVNSIITGFYKKGYIELRELPEDRRTKTVHLTEQGKAYMETFSPHIENAEYEAMQALSEQQRTALLECIQLYGKVFREKILED
ncbi:MAG: MarR family winged helix-turn-helix transcriptional regulator [Clostridiales bacterium]|nr:MarR family winged helix-turn-helix transcriptional regulator [Clostridiales bacterium]